MNIILANLNFTSEMLNDILAAFDKEQDLLNFLTKRHPNIKFTIEK